MADRAAGFKAEAEKALNRTTIFGFGKAQKFEDAAENFKKAGDAYKYASQWTDAGEMFLKAADNFVKADSNVDAVQNIVAAGDAYKKRSPVEAIACYERAIEHFSMSGRMGQIAKYEKEIADLYDASGETAAAMAHYTKAADMFSADNKRQQANPCLIKVATISSDNNDFARAAEIFERMGRESMESRLGAYSAKGFWLQCLLCHMAAGDNVATPMKMEEFKGVDHTFAGSRECGLIERLVEATEAQDGEMFADACAEFDNITPLDAWKTSMLLKAKGHIMSADGDEEPDLT